MLVQYEQSLTAPWQRGKLILLRFLVYQYGYYWFPAKLQI